MTPIGPEDLSRFSMMDLFRHSANADTAGADVDFTADTRVKTFSLDGGIKDVKAMIAESKKHGLDLDILYTNGGGETLQAVISGSMDLACGDSTTRLVFPQRVTNPGDLRKVLVDLANARFCVAIGL